MNNIDYRLLFSCNYSRVSVVCFDVCNKFIVVYLTNEILRNANEIHFISSNS